MRKILIIEDNFEVRDNLAELLELSNFKTISAKNGKVGIKKTLNHYPDLILCDILMPGFDGYEVLHILAKNPKTSHIPIIFLTAKSEKSDFRKGMNLGATDYLVKPFDYSELIYAIENRLKKNDLLIKSI